MIVAQISDLHIGAPGHLAYERIDAAAHLARCMKHILQLAPRPEAVIASGDLVDGGTVEEYRRLRELLAPLPMPVYLMPGNHDDRSALRAEFRDHAYLPADGTLHYAIETQPVRLIMLDTVVPGMDGGALDATQLEWLAATLAAAPDEPVLVFMHHPPIRTGISGMDEIGLAPDSAARLGAIVSRHRQIECITCGHVHRDIETLWHGTRVSICPSTAFQSVLDLATGKFEANSDEPPAYQLHYWNGNGIVTHTVAVTG